MAKKKSTLFKIVIIIACICFAIASCSRVTQSNFEKVKSNMTVQQVISILGEPTSSDSVEILGVTGTVATWKDKKAEIDIQFLNNQVFAKTFSTLGNEENQHRSRPAKRVKFTTRLCSACLANTGACFYSLWNAHHLPASFHKIASLVFLFFPILRYNALLFMKMI